MEFLLWKYKLANAGFFFLCVEKRIITVKYFTVQNPGISKIGVKFLVIESYYILLVELY